MKGPKQAQKEKPGRKQREEEEASVSAFRMN
jgi:hypothetical protein